MGITPVRYDNPNPQSSPFAALLSGLIQGGAGQIGLQQQQAQKQQEDNAKYMSQIAVAMAQQNRLGMADPTGYNAQNKPIGFEPGSFPLGGQQFKFTPSPIDYTALKNQQEAIKLQNENNGDNAAWADKAAGSGLASAITLAGLRQAQGDQTGADRLMQGSLQQAQQTRDYFRKSKSAPRYSAAQEKTIQDNMKAHNKSRDEVVQALTNKGYL